MTTCQAASIFATKPSRWHHRLSRLTEWLAGWLDIYLSLLLSLSFPSVFKLQIII